MMGPSTHAWPVQRSIRKQLDNLSGLISGLRLVGDSATAIQYNYLADKDNTEQMVVPDEDLVAAAQELAAQDPDHVEGSPAELHGGSDGEGEVEVQPLVNLPTAHKFATSLLQLVCANATQLNAMQHMMAAVCNDHDRMVVTNVCQMRQTTLDRFFTPQERSHHQRSWRMQAKRAVMARQPWCYCSTGQHVSALPGVWLQPCHAWAA